MSGLRRVLSLAAGFCLASGVMLATCVGTYNPEILEVGPALTNGTVQFTLNAGCAQGSLSVSLPVVAGDSAAVVATKIQAAVFAVGGSTWSAQATDRTVTFSFFNGATWSSIANITGLSNTASAQDYLTVDNSSWGDTVTLAVNGNASGVVAGTPGGSNLTIWVNGVLTYSSIKLTSGMSSSAILSSIATYLNALTVSGYGSYFLVDPHTLQISILTDHAAIEIRTNDTGLQGQVVMAQSNGGGSGGGGIGHSGGNPPE